MHRLSFHLLCCSAPAAVVAGSSSRLPIYGHRRHVEYHDLLQKRAPGVGAIGLGNYMDMTYNVLLTVGGVQVPLVLDSGSADFWVLSDRCTGNCTPGVPLYPEANFRSSGLEVRLLYGDSLTGTAASGVIGNDAAALAGLSITDQYFAAISQTNTSVLNTTSAGIFGLGFPINSVVFSNLFRAQFPSQPANEKRDLSDSQPIWYPDVNYRREESGGAPRDYLDINLVAGGLGVSHAGRFPKWLKDVGVSAAEKRSLTARRYQHLERKREEPGTPIGYLDVNLDSTHGVSSYTGRFPAWLKDIGHSTSIEKRQARVATVEDVLASFTTFGPLIPRLVATGQLKEPLVAVTLQRDTVERGGNIGQLNIGELPSGVQRDSLTWVPLRGYPESQGGLRAPQNSPNEIYPLTWEVYIDDVYLDGVKVAPSSLTPASLQLSALLDTGNSLLRGPADVVMNIRQTIMGAGNNFYPCSEPHVLEFEIGGQRFPVDPRDLVRQQYAGDMGRCNLNIVPTDTPEVGPDGGFLFSWSLGDPFLKSVLAAFYYGNITHPSQNSPRIGLLSTVPDDASDLLRAAVASANENGGNFPRTTEAAPTSTFPPGPIGKGGVRQANPGNNSNRGNGATPSSHISLLSVSITLLVTLAGVVVL